MTGRSTLSVLQHLHRLAREEQAGTRSDRECLERFVAQRDEDAFAVLVRRHGPMVLGVCRRILHHRQDAEDAFQATFLVLARKAGSVRWKRSIGPWLHQVAYRLAHKGRVEAARRREHESQTTVEAPSPGADSSWREVCAVLDEELQRLAEKYRAPLVLCYLEGQTRDEAAERLGWSLGTLKRRLQQGRELLRVRLTRRGVSLPAVLLPASLTGNEAEAALSSLAARALAQAATAFASGGAISGPHLPAVPLAEGMLQMMSTKIVKILALLLLALSMASGAGLWTCRMLVAQPPQVQPASPPDAARDRGPRQAVEDEKPHTDCYGDPLPPGALARLGTLRFRHEGEAAALAFSPDGRILAGLCRGGIVLWNAASGRELRRLDLLARGLDTRPFDFSPDGRLLAAMGIDNKIVFCEVATGKRVRTLSIPVEFAPVASLLRFSPDGKRLAVTAGVDKIAVLDSQSGKVIRTIGGHRAAIYGLAFAPDGKALALATLNPSLQLWDVETGKLRRGIEQKPKDTFAHTVTFSPDGRLLAAGWWDRIGVYDAATGKEVASLEAKLQSINGLAFTPDGKTLVAGGQNGKVCVWDVAEKKLRHTLGGQGVGRGLALSPDGKTAALASSLCAIRLWDIGSGKELFIRFGGHNARLHAVAFSPDGRTLFSGGDNQQIRLWRTTDWRQTRLLPGSALSLSVSPDGKRLASVPYNKTIRVWDTATGKDVYKLQLPDTETIRWAYFAAGGETLVSLDDTRLPREQPKNQYRTRVIVWDMANGRQRRSMMQVGIIPYSFALTPDGRTGLVGTSDCSVLVWDLLSGEIVRTLRGFKHHAEALAVSPDGRLLFTGSLDRGIRLWEVDSGAEILTFARHPRAVTAVAFSTDGRVAASADGDGGVPYPVSDPRQIRLWDVAAGKELGRLQGHTSDVSALAFSPEGRRLVSAMGDSTLLVWDVAFLADAVRRKRRDLDRAELERAWQDLSSADAGAAHRAVWTLTDAPRQAIPILKEHLRPVKIYDVKQVRGWIAKLDSDDFKKREAAFRALAQSGRQVEPELRRTLADKPSLEMRRRVEDLLRQLLKDPSAETLRSLRAIAVLERIGTAEARRVLQKLAGGAPAARETCAATDALQRLGEIP